MTSLLIPHRPNQAEPKAVLVSFQSGLRLNMVPDAAEAVIEGPKKEEIMSSFKDMLRTTDQKGEAAIENGQLILRMYGLSCHAMEPNNGINAGILVKLSLLEKFAQ